MTHNETTVYWSTCHVNHWQIYVAKTGRGICYVGSPNQPFEEVEAWIEKKIPNATFVESDSLLQQEISEISAYLLGEKEDFTVSMDLIGTEFQQAVWHASVKIPYGETRTYSEIAKEINRPKALRAVGTAIGANPLLFIIPCHRIVAKNGGLAGFRAGIDVKKVLLQLESKNNGQA
ncbi:MAG TPA: methylated-DNA--[protein]-cysteine S-methyltransferase [Pseudogracilibacillus sp.]|nr:methylated-DNA--[protein]-cysteine S-methyltransferase [Pseudogracilibacillus sp.]